MDLNPFLQQKCALGRSVNTMEERAIRNRIAAAELYLLRKPIPPDEEWIYHGVPQSEARKIAKENAVERFPSHKCKHRVGFVTGTWRMTRHLLVEAGLSIRYFPQKAQREQTIRGTIVWGGYP